LGFCFSSTGFRKCSTFPPPPPSPSLSGLLIVAAILETIGAALFLVGVFTRIVALILSGEMAFAYFMAHAPRSFYALVNGGELAVIYCFIFLYFAFAGGGPLSVDRAALNQA
jgi:putative oxidoreductase